MHLPAPYGYTTAASTNWTLISHLVNKGARRRRTSASRSSTSTARRRRRPPPSAKPLWLDIDGCGDSEYTAPVGYSDTHRRLDARRVTARMIAMSGHMHDVDITNASPCDDPLPRAGATASRCRPSSWAALEQLLRPGPAEQLAAGRPDRRDAVPLRGHTTARRGRAPTSAATSTR